MLGIWQTRIPALHVCKSAAPNGAIHFRKTGCYLCTFFLCFSLAFFLKGVLVGVGDGVPENSGVGDGRTRGWANIP
jgi:hypothetical protein